MSRVDEGPTIEQQLTMARYLVDAVVNDATGEADGDRSVGEPPSARYYLAVLAPADRDLTVSTVRRGRETPNSLGFEFEVDTPQARLMIDTVASVYYRVYPTYEEQLRIHGGEDDPDTRAGKTYWLGAVFQRVAVPLPSLVVQLDPSKPVIMAGAREFAAAFDRVTQTVLADPALFRQPVGKARGDVRVPGEALGDADRFSRWLEARGGHPLVPEWRASVSVVCRAAGPGRTRVTVLMSNDSHEPFVETLVRGEIQQRRDDTRDHSLFRVQLRVRATDGNLVPIRMNLGPDAYRYDPNLAAYATNCGVHPGYDPGGRLAVLESVPAPGCTTYRLRTAEHDALDFARLERDPIPVLEQLAAELAAYPANPRWSPEGLEAAQARVKVAEREAVRLEAARFQDGIRWMKKDPRLLLAFRLTNRTMAQVGEMTGKNYAGWRLFQLVFLVSQLPALAWREWPAEEFTPGLWGDTEDRDPTAAATVLWFPTGGGKTEAYLGLSVCAMFYDRARGKGVGVTAWCRFPLRLLTLQQTQRQLQTVVAANAVWEKAGPELMAVGGTHGDPFALGFLVGGGNTPNSLSRDPDALVRLADPERRAQARVVDQCPYCQQRAVTIPIPDATDLRLRHQCEACGKTLPVYVVDNEIYRYLPALVVGTIDKLAVSGLSDKFGALLGDVDCECPAHGFGRGGKCQERRMQGHAKDAVRPLSQRLYDPSPSLEIVDELHMLREELGAFDGHYETGLATIQRQLTARQRTDGRGVRMKVVATTATIKGEDRQCEHLFGLRSVVLPLPGPTLDGSFYWGQTPDPQRWFVGLLPARLTSEMTLVRTLTALHAAIQRLDQQGTNADPRFADWSPDAFARLVDLYRVSLTYVTSLVDFGKLRRSMETQVNWGLQQRGRRPLRVEELSSDTAAKGVAAIREIVDDLEHPGGGIDAVIATSMVSHGVDIERLNLMVFNGMPKSMAEYIQASSRVGRRYLGVVFMVYNPVRERDRSHYRYHGKFHEYIDRMVEPVAINRWSKFAAAKTLPGIFMAEVLQPLNREWWDQGHAPQHLHELARMQVAIRPPAAGGLPGAQRDALLAALEEAYLAHHPSAAELRKELPEKLDKALASIRAAGASGSGRGGGGRFQYRGTADYLGLEYEPMTSLRDVEEPIPFHVRQEGRRGR